MGCNGCQSLIGDSFRLTTGPTAITATGLSVQEVGRIYIPPLRDTIKVHGHVHVSATTVAQETVIEATLVPANSLNLLSAVAADGSDEVPHLGVINGGHRLEYNTLFHPDEYQPGDWVLGVTRFTGSNAGQVVATSILPAELWWER